MKIERTKKSKLPKDIKTIRILAEREVTCVEMDMEAPDEIWKDLAEYGLREIKKDRKELASYGFRRALENFIEAEKKKGRLRP
jgi:hypothetical protein